MGTVIVTPFGICAPAPTGKMAAYLAGSVGVFRLPADPLFTATLTLRNVIAGSRYRVTRTDTGDELAASVAAGTGAVDVPLAGLPCYANPQQMSVTVRNASGSPAYKIFDTSVYVGRSGGETYILQQLDE